jgi:hypothetical protein
LDASVAETREVVLQQTQYLLHAYNGLGNAEANAANAEEKMNAAVTQAAASALNEVEGLQSGNEDGFLVILNTIVAGGQLCAASMAAINSFISNAESGMADALQGTFTEADKLQGELEKAHAEVANALQMFQTVRDTASANKKDAGDALEKAIATFNSASVRREGTRPVSVNKRELTVAIIDAYNALRGVNVSTAANQVLAGEAFVTQSQMDALLNRINDAERVWHNVNATAGEVDAAVAALHAAVNAFAPSYGTATPEIGFLFLSIVDAVTFFGEANIDDGGTNTPFNERWVPPAAMVLFAGTYDQSLIDIHAMEATLDALESVLDDTSALGRALVLFGAAHTHNATQAEVNDGVILLGLAQWACYNAGGWGVIVDLFPEDGTAVWRLERNGVPVGLFASVYNAQRNAMDGDTLVLFADDTVDGLLFLYKDVALTINPGVTLTLAPPAGGGTIGGYLVYAHRVINNGTINIKNDMVNDSVLAVGIEGFPGSQFVNNGVINNDMGRVLIRGSHMVDGIPVDAAVFTNAPQGRVYNRPSKTTAHGAASQIIVEGTLNNSGVITNEIEVANTFASIIVINGNGALLNPPMPMFINQGTINNRTMDNPGTGRAEIDVRAGVLQLTNTQPFVNNGLLLVNMGATVMAIDFNAFVPLPVTGGANGMIALMPFSQLQICTANFMSPPPQPLTNLHAYVWLNGSWQTDPALPLAQMELHALLSEISAFQMTPNIYIALMACPVFKNAHDEATYLLLVMPSIFVTDYFNAIENLNNAMESTLAANPVLQAMVDLQAAMTRLNNENQNNPLLFASITQNLAHPLHAPLITAHQQAQQLLFATPLQDALQYQAIANQLHAVIDAVLAEPAAVTQAMENLQAAMQRAVDNMATVMPFLADNPPLNDAFDSLLGTADILLAPTTPMQPAMSYQGVADQLNMLVDMALSTGISGASLQLDMCLLNDCDNAVPDDDSHDNDIPGDDIPNNDNDGIQTDDISNDATPDDLPHADDDKQNDPGDINNDDMIKNDDANANDPTTDTNGYDITS